MLKNIMKLTLSFLVTISLTNLNVFSILYFIDKTVINLYITAFCCLSIFIALIFSTIFINAFIWNESARIYESA